MNFQKRRRRRYPGPSGFAGVKRESIVVMMERFTSANALVETDTSLQLEPGIVVVDRAACILNSQLLGDICGGYHGAANANQGEAQCQQKRNPKFSHSSDRLWHRGLHATRNIIPGDNRLFQLRT
jgi:hypothetical protein